MKKIVLIAAAAGLLNPKPKPSIPAGMKPWNGGPFMPEDWGGPPWMKRNGIIVQHAGPARSWWLSAEPDMDMVAYTPKASDQ